MNRKPETQRTMSNPIQTTEMAKRFTLIRESSCARTSKVTGRGVDVDERSERAALIPLTALFCRDVSVGELCSFDDGTITDYTTAFTHRKGRPINESRIVDDGW